MPADTSRWWHDKEGYGGQGFVQSDQTFDWRAPDTTQYNAYSQEQAATSGDYLDRLQRGENSYGEAMLQKGMGDASRAMASQAISRGANPAAERAAIMGGANMAAQNTANAAALRAQEMQAARMAHLQSLSQLRQGELGWGQLDAQMQQAAAGHYAQMAGRDIERDRETRETVSAAMGGVGSFMGGMMSDRRLKAAIAASAPETQDEIASRLASMEPVAPRAARLQQRADMARSGFLDDARSVATAGVPEEVRGARTGYSRPVRSMASSAWDDLADRLELQRYQYAERAREMGAPGGDRVGVMAQDMEGSQLGKGAVHVDPSTGYRSIDRDNALGLALGLHGRAAERLDEQDSEIERLRAALARKGQ